MLDRGISVLLLPGLLCDSFVWEAQYDALSRSAPTFVADFKGFDDITAMAASALALCSGPVIVIGHSMGARVALETVRLAGPRIAGLGLLDTGIHPRREGEAAKRQALVDLAFAEGMGALADAWLPAMVAPDRRSDHALMDPLRAMVMRMSPQIHARQIKALLHRPDPRPYLNHVTCPTLIMVGREDNWSPPSQHEEIAALIPQARLRIIENSGHMLPSEQPGPSTRELQQFVQSII